VLIGDTQLQSSSIDLPLTVELPTSIDALPGALWGAIEDNLGNVVTAMLSDTTTYQVIAIEIGKRGGAAAFAAMICRALREFLEGLAKQIAQQAVALASDAIAAVAALAGMLVAVALLGVKELLNLFEELWDKIKELFGDDDKKEEAEDRVNAYRRDVEAKIAVVTAKIAEARARMAISTLRTSLSDDGTSVIASVTWVEGRPTSDDAGNGHFTCTLDMLPGVPGTPGTPIASVALAQDTVAVPLATLGGGNYRMNAVARPAVHGITFMDDATAHNLAAAAETLRGIDNDVARSFGDYLDGLRLTFETMNTAGISGDPVYATTDVPGFMTVGKSRLGFNTRLPA
jgi:hypothetical protein